MEKDAYKHSITFLKKYFGYESFRKGQDSIVQSVLKGNDTLGVMPTGGGKSICYQIPALCLPGMTIVISPLISLMKDQIDTLKEKNYPAEMINSTIEYNEQRRIMEYVNSGRVKLLYLTPERFKNENFLLWLKEQNISMFAIDEAHCISEWGHDFRPDYRKINGVITQLGNPQILALTATATKEVRDDIIKVIGMKKPEIIINGFNRENLIYGVEEYPTKEDKNKGLIAFLLKVKKPGIIYTSSVKDANDIYNYLRTNSDLKFSLYHGKLQLKQRTEAQDNFLENKIDVLIATNAFGMGVDKQDIRFVVHYSIPGTIEAYYQETGRAGRDGAISYCLLQYMRRDEEIQNFFIRSKNPSSESIKEVFNYICKYSKDTNFYEDSEITDDDIKVSKFEKAAIIKILHDMNLISIDYLSDEICEIAIKKESVNDKTLFYTLTELVRMAGKNKEIRMNLNTILKRIDMSKFDFISDLNGLVSKKIINYELIPAGRVIKIIEKKIPNDILKEHEKKSAIKLEYDMSKLKSVVDYAELQDNDCRRKYLLNYFGEEFKEQNCGKCDICRKTNKSTSNKPDENDITILFAVYMNDGKFGKMKMGKLLKGSYELEEKYREIEEFGCLSALQIEVIYDKLSKLTRNALLYTNDSKYPTIYISEKGKKFVSLYKSSRP
ncbi:MAG TPA: hypothetical protein DDY71_14905 [Spirochaetia bacterium]|nr:MAG: hypothetical protein A2Y30_05770 [Spirochaetes bacterium GWE1_32_154]OHD49495.1 MAG: hypothetical protein A2Y29_01830 [Spirochaetes bacterium GWE2_31_10]HBD96236.1 hypothetical protein [Spirochaetia bacterium]HBI38928.1 hypothetical protein [Spirochaetia bacterium]